MGVHGHNGSCTIETDWGRARLTDLIGHIITEHHCRFRAELSTLQKSVGEVYVRYRERDFARLAPLPGILFLLNDELNRHMRREEVVIFPAIEALEKSLEERRDGAAPAQSHIADLISDTLWEHDNIAARLAEVRATTRDYELPSYAGPSYRSLFRRLDALERGQAEHTRLEDDILFRRALTLSR